MQIGLGLSLTGLSRVVRSELSRVIAALFSNDEPGFLFLVDPETCFTDTAGTTPAVVGDPVALWLDQSRGLELGLELADNLPAWTLETGWSLSDGVLSYDGTDSANRVLVDFSLLVGVTYEVSLSVSMNQGRLNVRPSATTTVGQFQIESSGVYKFKLVGQGEIPGFQAAAFGPDRFIGTVSNISIRELPGAHATQATPANRPILGRKPVGGRRNAFDQTENLNLSPWALRSASIGFVGSNEYRLTPNASTTDNHHIRQISSLTSLFKVGMNSIEVEAKADGGRWLRIRITADAGATGDRPGNCVANFDLAEGVTGFINTSIGNSNNTHTIQDLGDGWYRCRFNFAVTSVGTLNLQFAILASNNTADFPSESAGDKGPILLRRPNANATPEITPYQRVTTRFDVTEAGKTNRHYLFFGGASDPRWMQTPVITPGTDKVQVFAGLRKLADGAVGEVVTNGSFNDNKQFVMRWPRGAENSSAIFAARDPILVAASTPIAAPASGMLSGILADGEVSLRVNGNLVSTVSGYLGGELLASNIGIGSNLAGTTNFLNGEISALTARFGPNLDADQIELVENFTARKVAEETIT